jgi:hypothetical protein
VGVERASWVGERGASESCVGVGLAGAEDERAMVSTREASWSAGEEGIFFLFCLPSFGWILVGG